MCYACDTFLVIVGRGWGVNGTGKGVHKYDTTKIL